jgi:hypothetical protein
MKKKCARRPTYINQVLANVRHLVQNLHTSLFKHIFGTQTGSHEQLWRADRSSGQDDFFRRGNPESLAAGSLSDFYADGARLGSTRVE